MIFKPSYEAGGREKICPLIGNVHMWDSGFMILKPFSCLDLIMDIVVGSSPGTPNNGTPFPQASHTIPTLLGILMRVCMRMGVPFLGP